MLTSVLHQLALHSHPLRQRTSALRHSRSARVADHCHSSYACASSPSRDQRSNPPGHSSASISSRHRRPGIRTRIVRRYDHHGKQKAPFAGDNCVRASTSPSETPRWLRSRKRKRCDYARCSSGCNPVRLAEDLFCMVSAYYVIAVNCITRKKTKSEIMSNTIKGMPACVLAWANIDGRNARDDPCSPFLRPHGLYMRSWHK